MKAAEHRDDDTGAHVGRVASYVFLIAELLRLPDMQCRQLSLASTMHDIGKIALPDAILLKPGPPRRRERRTMEQHAECGRRILEAGTSDLLRLGAEIAQTHHERFDGTGYPKGLKGEANSARRAYRRGRRCVRRLNEPATLQTGLATRQGAAAYRG